MAPGEFNIPLEPFIIPAKKHLNRKNNNFSLKGGKENENH
jgi:hypothetical protein